MARLTTPPPEDQGAPPPPGQYPPPTAADTAGAEGNQQPSPPQPGPEIVITDDLPPQYPHQYPPSSPRPQFPAPPPVSPIHLTMQQQELQYYYPSKPDSSSHVGGGIPMQPLGAGAYSYDAGGSLAQPNGVHQGIPVGMKVQTTMPGYPSPLPTPNPVQAMVPPNMGSEQWSTGLFDCMEDPSLAFATFVAPCVTFGQIAEIIDNGQTTCGTSGTIYGAVLLVIWLPCFMSCSYRTRLRARYDLVEAPAPDWITHFFFECCALAQEYRELRNRGLDPAIGWYANMARQQNTQQGMMTPPMPQTMM